MKKYIIGLTLLLSTELVMATTQGTPTTTITAITTYPNSVTISTASTNGNVDNCTSNDPQARHQLILPLTDESKSVYAALLSAYVSEGKVRILYSGCVAGIPLIIRTDLKK